MNNCLKNIKRELFFTLLFLFFSSNILCALDVGQKAPDLKVSEWVKGSAVSFKVAKESKDGKIYVLFFWATWLKEASRFADFIMTEKQFYDKNNLVFVGISREKASLLKKFLKENPELDINLGVDDNSQSYNTYMKDVKGLPVFFVIGTNGKLLWKGSPIEFDRVIRRIIDDTFDSDDQEEIEKLREKVRDYSHLLNKEKETQLSLEILKIDPTDEFSVKLVSANMVREGKLEEAYKFIEESRSKVKSSQYVQRALFLNELEVIVQMPLSREKIYLEDVAKNYIKAFSNSPRYLNEFSIRLLKEFPLEVLPVNLLFEAVNKAIYLLEQDKENKENLGSYYLTLARLYYIVGNLDKAVLTQENAISILKNKDELVVAELNLSFYKEMIALNSKK